VIEQSTIKREEHVTVIGVSQNGFQWQTIQALCHKDLMRIAEAIMEYANAKQEYELGQTLKKPVGYIAPIKGYPMGREPVEKKFVFV
jgi:hypothetical protein